MVNIKMGGIERGGNWQRNAAYAGGALLGLGGLAYGLNKAYKAYDKAKFIKEASDAMNAWNSPTVDLTMESIKYF
jgi:uncharacterized membrane protein YebE (DUF533 family)